MSDQPRADGDDRLSALLRDLGEAADGHHATLGELVEAMERRGFGPLLALLSGLLLLPTGMIPGIPAAVGLLLILVGLQMIMGRGTPWLPNWLKRFRLPGRLVRRSIERARPFARRLGRVLDARLAPLAESPPAQAVIAAIVIVDGVVLIPIGFIPFLPFALAVNALLFGLALTMRNGLLAALGFVASAPGLWLAAQGVL